MIRIEFSKNKDNVINLASKIFSEFDLYWFKYWLNNGKLIECYYDNSLVGFCLVLIRPVIGIKGGIIMYIGVKESHRRKGIGSKILSFAENYFILHKCDSAFATTRIENKAAISFS
jgi:Acetyltransferase (GNAT) family.